jgi:hypothetical protein
VSQKSTLSHRGKSLVWLPSVHGAPAHMGRWLCHPSAHPRLPSVRPSRSPLAKATVESSRPLPAESAICPRPLSARQGRCPLVKAAPAIRSPRPQSTRQGRARRPTAEAAVRLRPQARDGAASGCVVPAKDAALLPTRYKCKCILLLETSTV